MKWIPKEEVLAHVTEYGEGSWQAILIEVLDEKGDTDYVDILISSDCLTDEIGRCFIVPALPNKTQ